jgi:deoxyadenosine/deoxycytidine kinase
MEHVVIRGNIGAGKSTVARRVADALGATLVEEPVAEWRASGALAAMYDGAVAAFQPYALATRVAAYRRAVWAHQPSVVVLDRWLDDDLAFATANLEAADLEGYTELWRTTNRLNPIERVFEVWIYVDTQTCLDRIRRRGRPEEASITAAYLRRFANPGDADLIVDGSRATPDEVAASVVRAFEAWRS